MKLIVAATTDEGIGFQGRLPWYIPADLQRFKELTVGGLVIMGRRTWESFPGKLPDRLNLVMSSRTVAGCDMCSAGFDVMHYALDNKAARQAPRWIIGGAQIYKEALDRNLIDEIYLTRVWRDPWDPPIKCDTFWPGVPIDDFSCAGISPVYVCPGADMGKSVSNKIMYSPFNTNYSYERWIRNASQK